MWYWICSVARDCWISFYEKSQPEKPWWDLGNVFFSFASLTRKLQANDLQKIIVSLRITFPILICFVHCSVFSLIRLSNHALFLYILPWGSNHLLRMVMEPKYLSKEVIIHPNHHRRRWARILRAYTLTHCYLNTTLESHHMAWI